MINNIKIFITGSSGYIGQCLIKKILNETNYSLVLLQGKNSEKIFFGKRIKYYYYDNLDFDIYNCLRKTKPDVVIHLAGHSVTEHKKDDLSSLIKANIIFGTNLLDAMKENGVSKIINTGSYWENFYQDGEYHPVNLYSSFKKCFFNILQFYVEVFGFSAITLKLYDVYGPGDKRKKIIPLLIETATNNNKLDMSLGKQYVDFVYIDDVICGYINAIKYIMKSNKSDNLSVDIGSAKPIQLKKLVLLIEKNVDKKININFGGREYRLREVMNPKANIEYTKKLLGWYPKIFINDGLKIVIDSYKNKL